MTAGVLGAGLLRGLIVALATILYALLLWAAAQGIQLMLSLEGQARESVALQHAILSELRRIGTS